MSKIRKEDIIPILEECYDPEIPIDLWNLGLIYDITVKDDNVNITMSLTTPGCTMGQYMADDIKSKLKKRLLGVTKSAYNALISYKCGILNDE